MIDWKRLSVVVFALWGLLYAFGMLVLVSAAK